MVRNTYNSSNEDALLKSIGPFKARSAGRIAIGQMKTDGTQVVPSVPQGRLQVYKAIHPEPVKLSGNGI
jgi:hypothetical protein